MPKYSRKSKERLSTCHEDLQKIFNEVIKHWDCTILEGHRTKETQDEYFRTGRSKLEWPNSKHNSKPSLAVDVAPWPIDWNDRERFIHFAGFVKGVANGMGIEIRCGADWNGDGRFTESFFDAPHFELVQR